MEERNGKPYEEIQLDFAFLAESETPAPAPTTENESPARIHRLARPRRLTKALTAAQTALLEAPLEEINACLFLLFEFCEAALTRALDVVPLRKGELFSSEEYRSLRGVGQAQWLLNEAQSRREMKATEGQGKRKRR